MFNGLSSLVNFSIYLISYLYAVQNKKTITLSHSYFISPVLMICYIIINLFVNPIEKKLGLRLSIILGTIINIASYMLLYFSKNFYISLISFGLNSFGCFYIPLEIRNYMSYFFEIIGKLLGTLSIPGALVNSGFNILAEKIIINNSFFKIGKLSFLLLDSGLYIQKGMKQM